MRRCKRHARECERRLDVGSAWKILCQSHWRTCLSHEVRINSSSSVVDFDSRLWRTRASKFQVWHCVSHVASCRRRDSFFKSCALFMESHAAYAMQRLWRLSKREKIASVTSVEIVIYRYTKLQTTLYEDRIYNTQVTQLQLHQLCLRVGNPAYKSSQCTSV